MEVKIASSCQNLKVVWEGEEGRREKWRRERERGREREREQLYKYLDISSLS